MVDSELLVRVKKLLGLQPRKFLVTGGTGFVGSHLARCLAEAGHRVTVMGRNRYRTNRIFHPNIQFVRGDIQNMEKVEDCCAGQEVVFHAAAFSSPWGKSSLFESINVDGTRNVIQACARQKVQRLVHVSSTSVFFNYQDCLSHDDSDKYAFPQSCHYSESKRKAEELVFEANTHGLNTFIIRARALFGEGDTTLLPRLIMAARDGKLRQIGDGQNRVDLTYIDNLVLALVMAVVRGTSGSVCTITNGEPVKIWELLPKIFTRLNIPYQGKQVPYRLVHGITLLREQFHRTIPWLGEPKLTCYTAGLLAKNQIFLLDAAKRELDYEPLISMQTGIDRTLEALTQHQGQPSETHVKLKCFTTGYATGNRRIVERNSRSIPTRFHAMVGLLDHPTHGLTLFDTGFAPRLQSLSGIAPWIYDRLLPAKATQKLAIASQLDRLGIKPADIARIIVSHFHPDHIAGLRDFPNADLIASLTAWQAIRNRKGWSALRHVLFPELLPADIASRMHPIEAFLDPGIGTFDRCHDLFGDGSVRLFELPGHAIGQLGALVQTSQSREFLVADAAWTSSAIRNEIMPHTLTRTFIHDFQSVRSTLIKLKGFNQLFPEVNLLPTHCPEVAERFEFDRQIEALESSKSVPGT